jgi:ABC-type multidrug transport system fused ATPase/permease subunit
MSADRNGYRAGWRMLGRELARQRGPLVRVAAWSVPEALPALLSGLVVARALDSGFLAHRPWTGLSWLGGLALILIVKAVATRMSFPWLCATIEPLRDGLVRTLVASTLQRTAASAGRPDAASIAQLTSQVEMTRQLVSALIRAVRPPTVALIAAIAGMAWLSLAIPAIVLPPLVLALLLFYFSLGSLSRRRAEVVAAGEAIATQAGNVLTGLRDVIACGAQDRAAADVGAAIDVQARAARAVAWAGSARVAVAALGYYVPLLALLAAAPWLTRHGWLTAGQVIGAVTYLTASLWPALNSLTGSVGSWGIQLGAILRRLDQACTPPTQPLSGGIAVPLGSELRISGLTFAYGATAEPVIRDLSLTLAEGEHLAIVGPSGIGKSTLARLLIRIHAGQRGQISFGGAALQLIPEPVLRQQIALVPQEAYIFGGTLHENLTYLRPDATHAELDACSAAVGLTPLVERLGGYEAVLGGKDGVLSDGERQLIAAGRVYLSPAALVILDEATCHLDLAAEARVERAFAARAGSLIVIAHRISSAQRAQRVLLLDGTRAILGTHWQLLNISPQYADLAGSWEPGVVTVLQRPARSLADQLPMIMEVRSVQRA